MYATLPLLFCRSEPARDGGLPADRNLSDVLSTCGSEPARESGLPADRNLADVLDTCGSELARDDGLSAYSILTDERTQQTGRPVGRLAFALAFDLLAPS